MVQDGYNELTYVYGSFESEHEFMTHTFSAHRPMVGF